MSADGETDEFQKSVGRDVMSDVPVPELPAIGSKASLPGKDSFQSASNPSMMPERKDANASDIVESESGDEHPVPPVI